MLIPSHRLESFQNFESYKESSQIPQPTCYLLEVAVEEPDYKESYKKQNDWKIWRTFWKSLILDALSNQAWRSGQSRTIHKEPQ